MLLRRLGLNSLREHRHNRMIFVTCLLQIKLYNETSDGKNQLLINGRLAGETKRIQPCPSSLNTSSRFSASFSFFPRLRFLPPFPEQRKQIIRETEPCIYITQNGMKQNAHLAYHYVICKTYIQTRKQNDIIYEKRTRV